MSPLIHQPSSQRTTKSVECRKWVQPLVYLSTSNPFLDMPIETRRHQSNDFQKFGSSKTSDLSLKKVSMMSSVFNTSTPTPDTNLLLTQRVGFVHPRVDSIPTKKTPEIPNSHDLWAFRLVFVFSMTQGAKYHPARTPASWSTKRWFLFWQVSSPYNFHQPIYFIRHFIKYFIHAIF